VNVEATGAATVNAEAARSARVHIGWRRAIGLAGAAVILGAAIYTLRPTGEVGYVEIKTALYIDSTKLAPIKEGTAILQQRVGTLRLQTDGIAAGSLAPLCDIVVKRNRITTVTISVLERPPRCQCRFSGADAARACVR
jgi:hypothetical protein